MEARETKQCPNLYSAWSSQDIPVPAAINAHRCYCPECLGERATESRPQPERYVGSKRRCKLCQAVDGVKYPKFLKSLRGSRTETCELYRGLCDRSECKRARRFTGDIADIVYAPAPEDKVVKMKNPAEEKALNRWASNPLPSEANKLTNCWPRPYAKTDEKTTAHHWHQVRDGVSATSVPPILDFGDPQEDQRKTQRLETCKTADGWKTRLVVDGTFDVIGEGTCKSSPLSKSDDKRHQHDTQRNSSGNSQSHRPEPALFASNRMSRSYIFG
jgi:hypothetical protein